MYKYVCINAGIRESLNVNIFKVYPIIKFYGSNGIYRISVKKKLCCLYTRSMYMRVCFCKRLNLIKMHKRYDEYESKFNISIKKPVVQ